MLEDINQLENILNKKDAKVYFIGIGGIAMSAAANLAKIGGLQVCGSDSKEIYAPAKDILDQNKIPYFAGFDAEHIKQAQADLYVLSAGEGPNNPEVKYLLEQRLPHAGFPELLYELTKNQLRVVVAGTHGKSTTAGLLGHLLKNLDDGSFMVGAVLQNYQSNFYRGDGHYFVFEGDEYKSEFDDPTPKFHYYKPDILVLTNLDYDHPDIYPSFEAMQQEFEHLVTNLPEDGLVVYNADDPQLSKLAHQTNVSSVSFGIDNPADFEVINVDFGQEYTTIDVRNKFSKDVLSTLTGQGEEYRIQLPGKINVYNAMAAIATLRALGFDRQQIALDLLSYKGVKRRFEAVGVKNGITIIDDYAHHPTAVKETLEAARLKYPDAKIWAVFEPHTFSRTKATLADLARSFDAANEVLVSEIYPARESAKDATITSQEVVDEIKSKIPSQKSIIRLVHNKQEALDIIKNEAKPGDVIIVMAVGSFNRLAYELKDVL
jgi:UDP-N-acetylmuramate--L-alanine ligase